MKASILDLAIYIFRNYPNPTQLSKPRLVKLIYLIDWKHCLLHNSQATNIQWYFNHYGPYVEDVINELKAANSDFRISSYANPYGGGISDRIVLISNKQIRIENELREIIDLIILHTNKLNWTDFINLIYSTYPIRKYAKYSKLNLIETAKEYKEKKAAANKG